jgi:hypothetical protein
MRIVPPLTVSDGEIAFGLELLDAAIGRMVRSRQAGRFPALLAPAP